MSRTVDEIYLSIAQSAVDAIDEDWEKLSINVEFLGDAAEFDCVYIASGSGRERDFSAGYQFYKDFKELFKIMTEEGSNLWNRAVFKLTPDGDFSIDFKWDDDLAEDFNA